MGLDGDGHCVAPGQVHALCSGHTGRDVPGMCPRTPDNQNPAM